MKKQPTICSYCQKQFFYRSSKNEKYCNFNCYKQKLQSQTPILNCRECGTKTPRKWRILCDPCYTKFKVEKALTNSPNGAKIRWSGHQYAYHANGYLMIKVPQHPFSNKRGYVYQHRLVMEKKLGRFLKKEEAVHHKDGNKKNNAVTNLVMFRTSGEHTTYHLLHGDVGKKNKARRDESDRLLESRDI